MSLGNSRGSYRKINPQLAQCVESVQLLYQGLNRAPDEWWKKHDLMVTEAPVPPPADDYRIYNNNSDGFGDDSDSEAEKQDEDTAWYGQ